MSCDGQKQRCEISRSSDGQKKKEEDGNMHHDKLRNGREIIGPIIELSLIHI